MRTPNRRETTLLGLLAVVVVIVLYLHGGASGDAGLDGAQPGGGLGAGAAPAVELERLAHEPEPYDPRGRNLFAYGSPPRPPVEYRPPPPVVVQTAPRPAPPPPPQPAPRPAPQGPPPPPKPTFAYLGFLGPKDNRIAVFEEGQNVLLARAGDVVQSQFRLLEFKYEIVVLGFTDERFAGKTTELAVKTAAKKKR